MLYNALNVPEVYADNDGATQNKYGSDGAYVTMMDTLNVNGSSQYKIVTNSDADTAVNNIAGYVGAAAEVIYNKDGDVLALSDIKTQFLSGEYKSNGKFEADNGTTYSIASDAYKEFVPSSKEDVANTTGKTQNATKGVVTIDNGIISFNKEKKLDKENDGGENFTLAATVSGKTITGIYSIATWKVSTSDKVDSSDISQIERNQKLLSKEFALDDDQEIDTSSFILNGVDSLSDIKADNIVYVYVGDKKIKRVDVGTETVTGTISKTTSTKVTINGTAYEISEESDLDGSAGSGDLAAGNEVTLYLDYAGDIYDADLVDGSAGNFAVIVTKSDTAPSKSSVSGTAKVELLTADGSKVFEINGTKYIDNGSLGVSNKVLSEEAWDSIEPGTIVQYSVNDAGQVTKLKEPDSKDYGVGPDDETTSLKVTKAGYLDSRAIADSALIFAVPQNSGNTGFDWEADSDDFAVVKKSAILDTSVSRVTYVYDIDTNKIVCMIIDDSSTSDDQYGIVTATGKIDGGESADFYIGTEKVSDGEISGDTPNKASKANELYKISKTTSGDYKFESASAKKEYTATKDGNGVLTSSVTVKNGYVQFNSEDEKYNLYDDVIVYVYDKADDAFSIGTTSDLTDDTLISAKIYMTGDADDDSYGLVDYIVITME